MLLERLRSVPMMKGCRAGDDAKMASPDGAAAEMSMQPSQHVSSAGRKQHTQPTRQRGGKILQERWCAMINCTSTSHSHFADSLLVIKRDPAVTANTTSQQPSKHAQLP